MSPANKTGHFNLLTTCDDPKLTQNPLTVIRLDSYRYCPNESLAIPLNRLPQSFSPFRANRKTAAEKLQFTGFGALSNQKLDYPSFSDNDRCNGYRLEGQE